jgi:hypothetical protein
MLVVRGFSSTSRPALRAAACGRPRPATPQVHSCRVPTPHAVALTYLIISLSPSIMTELALTLLGR